MDRTDRKILDLLARDSRMTGERLGNLVGLSASAAHRRVRTLEQTGHIAGYRAVLSPEARGRPSTVFVSVTLVDQRQATMQVFEAALADTPEVREAHLMSGESDYLLKVPVPAADTFERIHRDTLARLPGVQRLVSQFAIRTVIDAE